MAESLLTISIQSGFVKWGFNAMLIKELKNKGFDFERLPADIIASIAMLEKLTRGTFETINQKMEVLDSAIFDAIESLFPDEKIIYDVAYLRTVDDLVNEGFNTVAGEAIGTKNIAVPDTELIEFMYGDEGIFEFERAKEFVKKWLNYEIIYKIDEGSNGAAYLLPNGNVLKLTRSKSEAEGWSNHINKPTKHFSEIYNVIQIGDVNLWAIEREYVPAVSEEDDYVFRRTIGNTNAGVNIFEKEWYRELELEDQVKAKKWHEQVLQIMKHDRSLNDIGHQNIGLKNGDVVCFDCYKGGGTIGNNKQAIEKALIEVDRRPSVKYWMQPEFGTETRKYPQTEKPNSFFKTSKRGTLMRGGKWERDDIIAYDASGNIVGSLSMAVKGDETGAFKIVVREDSLRQGWGKKILNEAQQQGIDIIGNINKNSFSASGRYLVRRWLEDRLKEVSENKMAEGGLLPKKMIFYHGVKKSENVDKIIKEGFDLSYIKPLWQNDYAISVVKSPQAVQKFFGNKEVEILKIEFNGTIFSPLPFDSIIDSAKDAKDYTQQIIEKGIDAVRLGGKFGQYFIYNIKAITKIERVKTMNQGGNVNTNEPNEGRVASVSSRFRPWETIVFEPALKGLNGNSLVSYTWAWEPVSATSREGDEVMKRVSDWSNAETSADTGRSIVHKYTVQTPEGFETVSSESVPVLLGFVDRKAMKSFPNLATAAKTLAKQQMQLAILEEKKKEREEAEEKVKQLILPAIISEEDMEGKAIKHRMGDAWAMEWKHSENYEEGKISDERMEVLKDGYHRNRLKEMGIEIYANYSGAIYDLKKRIERQKRKIQEILEQENN